MATTINEVKFGYQRFIGTLLADPNSTEITHHRLAERLRRRSEILSLKWSDYREGNLYLRDSKTGPRTVWLSSHARKVLDALPCKGPWVFPGSRTNRPMHDIFHFWQRVRKEAAIGDVRQHDLRHSYASVALARCRTRRVWAS